MEPILGVEPILIVVVVVLLFGSGGYWGRQGAATGERHD